MVYRYNHLEFQHILLKVRYFVHFVKVHLFHGGKDKDVPVETSFQIIKNIDSNNVKLCFVKDANHQFSRDSDLKLIFRSIEEIIAENK